MKNENWIETKEALPRHMEAVLCYCPNGRGDYKTFIAKLDHDSMMWLQTVYSHYDGLENIGNVLWRETGEFDSWEITHWQLLPTEPEIPKEKSLQQKAADRINEILNEEDIVGASADGKKVLIETSSGKYFELSADEIFYRSNKH